MIDPKNNLQPGQVYGRSSTARDYIMSNRFRTVGLSFLAILLSIIVAVSYVGIPLDSIIVPLVVLFLFFLPIVMWRYPKMTAYTVFGAVCLIEVLPTFSTDALTDRIPFFWNINYIFQLYLHANVKAIPLNVFETLVLLAGFMSLLRAVYTKSFNLQTGRLIWPIGIYVAFVGLGWFHGMVTGGDFKDSLQEVRSQIYLLVAYLMAVNVFSERKSGQILLWTLGISMGIKGFLYTFRRYVTLHGLPIPDQGVGSHEEAFLFDCAMMLLVVLGITRSMPKLKTVLWMLLPLILLGDLACNRRAGTAAIIIAIPIVFAAAYRALPNRRRLIGILGVVVPVLFYAYFLAFRHSDAIYAQPARAVESQYNPDPRDLSSNLYRDAENADIMATIKLEPLLGYGYGKRMLHAYPIADISKTYPWWDLIPHNSVFWVWMRVGSLGFISFWMMVSAIIITACQTAGRSDLETDEKAVCLLSIGAICMLTIFGLLDLQVSNFRDTLFVGLMAGAVDAILIRKLREAALANPASVLPFWQRNQRLVPLSNRAAALISRGNGAS